MFALGFKRWKHNPTQFVNDERGNLIIIFAFAIMVLFLFVGAAVDYSRAVKAESTMANLLDSATLTTTRDLSFGEIAEDKVEERLQAVYKALAMAAGLEESQIALPKVSYNPLTGEVAASLTLSVDTAFLSLAGYKTLDLGIASSAVYSKKKVELAVVVDVTGSMKGSKLSSLKSAAKELVDTLLPADAVKDGRVRIGLVPYSEGVNGGDYSKTVFKGYPKDLLKKLPSSILSTVEALLGTDILSSVKTGSANGKICFTERDEGEIEDAAPVGEDKVLGVSEDANCSDSEMIALTEDRSKLISAIDGFSASGMTAGHTGIQWGWYMLAPKWNDFWSGYAGPVAEYDDDDAMKVVIIMTDGSFNTYYDNKAGDKDSSVDNSEKKAIKKQEFPNQVEFAGDWGDKAESRDRALTMCGEMEEKGVRIFTIAFKAPSDAKELMQKCASADGGYYDASSSAALTAAFKSIADVIRSLHLSS